MAEDLCQPPVVIPSPTSPMVKPASNHIPMRSAFLLIGTVVEAHGSRSVLAAVARYRSSSYRVIAGSKYGDHAKPTLYVALLYPSLKAQPGGRLGTPRPTNRRLGVKGDVDRLQESQSDLGSLSYSPTPNVV